MRVSAIQWSKLFIVVLPTHKYMYTSSTTTLQLCLLGPLGMHYQFSHFNNRGQWYSKVTNKIFTVLSSAVTNSGAVIKSGRQLIQSLRYLNKDSIFNASQQDTGANDAAVLGGQTPADVAAVEDSVPEFQGVYVDWTYVMCHFLHCDCFNIEVCHIAVIK